jgi:hypothetical protein
MLSPEILKKLKIDECDMALFNSYKWHVSIGKYPYLCTKIKLPNGRWVLAYFHRLIMNAPNGVQVDHINGGTLDNRRCNLRLCTSSQNHQNSRKRKLTSKFFGAFANLNFSQEEIKHGVIV